MTRHVLHQVFALVATCSLLIAGCNSPAQVPATPTTAPTVAATSTTAPTSTPVPTSTSTNTPAPTLTFTPLPPTATATSTPSPSPSPRPTLAPTATALPQRTQSIEVVDKGMGQWVPQSFCVRGGAGQQHAIVVGDCKCGGSCGQSRDVPASPYLPVGYQTHPQRGAPYVGLSLDGKCQYLQNTQNSFVYNFGDGASVILTQAGAQAMPDGSSKRMLTMTLVGLVCK